LGLAVDVEIEARIGLHGAATARDQMPAMEAFHELAQQTETVWAD
jgi:hypothetical protein